MLGGVGWPVFVHGPPKIMVPKKGHLFLGVPTVSYPWMFVSNVSRMSSNIFICYKICDVSLYLKYMCIYNILYIQVKPLCPVKLTFSPLKMDAWFRWHFLFGVFRPIFKGKLAVRGRGRVISPPRASVVEQQHKVFRSGPTKVKDLGRRMDETLLEVDLGGYSLLGGVLPLFFWGGGGGLGFGALTFLHGVFVEKILLICVKVIVCSKVKSKKQKRPWDIWWI